MDDFRGKNVLIVDDESDWRKILAEEFVDVGANTFEAGRVDEALSVIESQELDAIVSDIRMPGASGKELLIQMRSLQKELPCFFFMTGFSDLSLEEAYDLGAQAVFKKPLNIEALLYAMGKSLQPVEKRWTRANLRLPVSLEVQLRYEQNQRVAEHTANIGRGGVFVRIQDGPMPDIHQRIGFEIDLESYGMIKGVGLVRWVRRFSKGDLPKGFGLEFEGLDSSSRQSLLELLNALQTQSFIPKH